MKKFKDLKRKGDTGETVEIDCDEWGQVRAERDMYKQSFFDEVKRKGTEFAALAAELRAKLAFETDLANELAEALMHEDGVRSSASRTVLKKWHEKRGLKWPPNHE